MVKRIQICTSYPQRTGPGGFKIRTDKSGVLITSEEAGTLWIWAHPELLGWPHPVVWIAPHVSSDGEGDLIGIDAWGDVLAVETKRSTRKSRLKDPFEDFVPARADKSAAPSVDKMRMIWRELLEQERAWIAAGCPIDETKKVPGVVPYSYHRASVARWYDLYHTAIKPIVLSRHYEDRVEANLAVRQRAVELSIHFIGLFTTCHDCHPGLSKSGRHSYHALVERVSASKVHLRGLRAIKSAEGVVIEQVDVEPVRASG